jgi:2-C-methyl-D-erythritol 2,4-cyclodiphosphate synthase
MPPRPIHRIGLGTDLHRLVPGVSIRLGGVDVPASHRADGHSDADVVIHALIDALCGAAGLPDIGEHFPDTDPRYKNADSRTLLAQVVEEIRSLGYAVANADVVIQLERPKLGSHKAAMRASLAGLLGIPADAVSVKAKSGEGVDAVGCGEAVACIAIVGLTSTSK